MIKCFLALTVASFSLATPGFADVSAVGRLENTLTGQTCTGALISAQQVLTAAHCVAALSNTDETQEVSVIFRPGSPADAATFETVNSAFHPLYKQPLAQKNWKIRFDLAIFTLKDSVPENVGAPMKVGAEASVGETLFLVSWRGGNPSPPRQRACKVIDGTSGLVSVACTVAGGESGAPLFRKTQSGLELVAVLSSRASQGKQPIGLATDVAIRLPPLQRAMKAGEGS